jgi:hypothetical protein
MEGSIQSIPIRKHEEYLSPLLCQPIAPSPKTWLKEISIEPKQWGKKATNKLGREECWVIVAAPGQNAAPVLSWVSSQDEGRQGQEGGGA